MRRLPAFLGFAVQVSIRDLTGYAITADGVLHLMCQSALVEDASEVELRIAASCGLWLVLLDDIDENFLYLHQSIDCVIKMHRRATTKQNAAAILSPPMISSSASRSMESGTSCLKISDVCCLRYSNRA